MNRTYPIVKYPRGVKPPPPQDIALPPTGRFGRTFDALPPERPHPNRYYWAGANAICGAIAAIAWSSKTHPSIWAAAIACLLFSTYQYWRGWRADIAIASLPQYRQHYRTRSAVIKGKKKSIARVKLTRSHVELLDRVSASERFFLARLQKVFPTACFGHQYLPEGSPYPYSTDIEIVIDDWGFQIEIDEPYSNTSREPRHCCDNDRDRRRDEYFTRLGWIVIRFSEKQIVTDPNGCIGTIANTTARFTGRTYSPQLINAGKCLASNRRWTSKTAKQLARERYRERYLAKAGLWKPLPSESAVTSDSC